MLDQCSNLLAGKSPEYAEQVAPLAGGCFDLADELSLSSSLPSSLPSRSEAETRPLYVLAVLRLDLQSPGVAAA